MSQKVLSFTELLDLIELDVQRKIIDGLDFVNTIKTKGMPRVIHDTRGALRLAVERDGEDYSVTQYSTELARESVNGIYPIANVGLTDMEAANDNGRIDLDLAA